MSWALALLERAAGPLYRPAPPQGDARRHARTRVALSATLHQQAETAEVTVADLSPGGAMIRTGVPPTPGVAVLLVRGSLWTGATVVWSSANRCGLKFGEEIDVGAWVRPLRNVGQRRIDQAVAEYRNGGRIDPEALPQAATIRHPLSDDLTLVLRIIADLRADLSYSPETLRRHPDTVPLLDSAAATLSDPALARCTGHQFVEDVGSVFEIVRELEDELTSCSSTLR